MDRGSFVQALLAILIGIFSFPKRRKEDLVIVTLNSHKEWRSLTDDEGWWPRFAQYLKKHYEADTLVLISTPYYYHLDVVEAVDYRFWHLGWHNTIGDVLRQKLPNYVELTIDNLRNI